MTELEVANLALALLDETPIDALNEDVKAARLMATHYDQTRRAELSKHLWFFALTSETLIGTDSGSGFGTLNWEYDLPSVSLRLLPLTDNGEFSGVPISYRLVGSKISTDQQSPRIVRFVQDVVNPDAWPPLFTEVMAAALAVKVAHPLTHKTGMIEIAKAAYQEALADAKRINLVQSFGQLYTQSWAQARGDHRYWRA